jgi:hypothetical protein
MIYIFDVQRSEGLSSDVSNQIINYFDMRSRISAPFQRNYRRAAWSLSFRFTGARFSRTVRSIDPLSFPSRRAPAADWLRHHIQSRATTCHHQQTPASATPAAEEFLVSWLHARNS